MPLLNIDTDMIIPKQFLKTIKRTGLGKNLFFEMRYDDKGNSIKDFILNKKPFNNSKILLAGKNFGCGSSREHAPWALLDFGIKCVIAPSFADIFYSNCFKNGILPIVLEEKIIQEIAEYSKREENVEILLKTRFLWAVASGAALALQPNMVGAQQLIEVKETVIVSLTLVRKETIRFLDQMNVRNVSQ